MSDYKLICGMEIHAELKTASKMFCGCKNDPFGAEKPNIHTCPVCLGMPGGLPVANKKAIEWTIKLGLALNCKIHLFSHFDRKHYFYPDLPKGYQISQYDLPFCYDGKIETEYGDVRIRRIHLEEDTGKLLHKTVDGKKVSLIDFNRSSVPLVEIVTEPDIHTPEHAKAYAKSIRQILRFLDIADCDMEQGGMRLEANVSLSADGSLPPYKVELKNINSFRFLEKAIHYETERQAEVLKDGRTPIQETRGWNDNKGETFTQRVKEEAEDYRYFPDPDLPPMRFTQQYVDEIKANLPELPQQIKTRWKKEFGVEERYSEVLIENRESTNKYEAIFTEAKERGVTANQLANMIVNKKIVIDTKHNPAEVIASFQKTQQSDEVDPSLLVKTISAVIAENPDAVAQYKSGKVQVMGFFMGQVLRKLGKKLDSTHLQKRIAEELKK